MLDSITPLILTFNEAPNIERSLSKLGWAKDIVVVDSYSSDETLEMARKFPQVRIFQRAFDSHANQWNYGLKETGISTDWVLALDADYVLSDELVEELKRLNPADETQGYRARFKYCVEGKPLRGSVYPPVTVLYRREGAFYKQDGHTQLVVINGAVEDLLSPILHDDRKSLSDWVVSQNRYMKLEARKLTEADPKGLGWADKVRLLRFPAPALMLLYCLFVKGLILDGRAGIYYALQRTFAELLLSLHVLQKDIEKLRGFG